MQGANYDIHEVVATDTGVQAVWVNAEVFDPKTEHLFKYLQVKPMLISKSKIYTFILTEEPKSLMWCCIN